MKNYIAVPLAFVLCAPGAFAQDMTAAQYIAKYKDIAMLEMRREGVPAAISLAQGLLETENGNSDLVKESNNHFGIKCKDNWTQATVTHDDDARNECFRAYKTAADSYRDHSDFLRSSSRYAFLFKLDPTDYRDWAYGLSRAGYATNPQYASILIKNIEDNNLEQYTQEAMNLGPLSDSAALADEKAASQNNTDTSVSEYADTNDGQPQDEIATPGLTSINGCKVIFVTKGTSLLAIAMQNNIGLGRLLQFNDLQQDGILDHDQYLFLEKKKKSCNSDYYIVRSNETLRDISQKEGVLLQSLCEYNQITPYVKLVPGEKILLKPASAIPNNAVAAPSGSSDGKNSSQTTEINYRPVQPGETIYAFAKKYCVPVYGLAEWNHLGDYSLQAGQPLIIPT
jgi:LysM repeat protein